MISPSGINNRNKELGEIKLECMSKYQQKALMGQVQIFLSR